MASCNPTLKADASAGLRRDLLVIGEDGFAVIWEDGASGGGCGFVVMALGGVMWGGFVLACALL
jgi:hypothetical protein